MLAAVATTTLLLGSLPQPGRLGRRQLGRLAAEAVSVAVALPALAEEMRTSANIGGYEQLTGEPGSSLGAGAISGRSRPRTGVCLLEPVQTVGAKDDLAVQALLALDGKPSGVAATTRFVSPYPLATGMYYDVEVRNREGDGAFMQVERLPGSAASLDSVDPAFFVDAVLSARGRFGAYGVPVDVSILSARSLDANKKVVEVAFSALTPGGTEQQRRALITALVPDGSVDAVMLVSGATLLRWKRGAEAKAREMAASFVVDNTRPTKIPRQIRSDYRYAEGTLFE